MLNVNKNEKTTQKILGPNATGIVSLSIISIVAISFTTTTFKVSVMDKNIELYRCIYDYMWNSALQRTC